MTWLEVSKRGAQGDTRQVGIVAHRNRHEGALVGARNSMRQVVRRRDIEEQMAAEWVWSAWLCKYEATRRRAAVHKDGTLSKRLVVFEYVVNEGMLLATHVGQVDGIVRWRKV